jgi:hypothetical protein
VKDDRGVESISAETELLQKAMMYFRPSKLSEKATDNKIIYPRNEESRRARKEFASCCHSDHICFVWSLAGQMSLHAAEA